MMESTPQILYEDRHLLLCVKQPGLSCEATGDRSLPLLLSQYYRERGQDDYIGVVHRLDQVAGGVMVFARRRDVASKLTTLFSTHQVVKEYLAVLCGIPAQDQDTLNDLLFRDASRNKTYVVQRMRRGVREASLSYQVQGTAGGLSLVRVTLHTGRTHQIRAQFAARKLPLLGDRRYGGIPSAGGVALWSNHLAFTHPITGKPMDFVCPPPSAAPWDQFT
jgi:23S rRNA pseudouridine1911/1915/1917 synthase